ncbi:MAG: glycosyltransferase family 4 protein [Kiritimatiellae bacterium]|nr:glycosyltransferase family 4 protein [Kiritimatiellia bacterium]
MRVLLVNTVAAMGGAEWSLLELAAALGRKGLTVEVACPEGALAQRLRASGLAVRTLPVVRLTRPRPFRPSSMLPWFRLPVARRALRRIVRQGHPDCVHANSLAAMLVAAPAVGAAPLLWHVRDLALAPAAARWSARRARFCLAISPAVEQRLRGLLPQSLQSKVRLVMNGIALERFADLPERHEARRRLGLPADVPLAGMLAHLVPWKRHDLFLAAAARVVQAVPAAHFAIAGEDLFREHAGYLQALTEACAREGLAGRMHWIGAVDRPEIYLRALDVLAHPAGDEPFGRAICEAMAAGTAVAAADAAGPGDLVLHETTGLLTPPGEVAGLAAAICRLLSEPALRQRLCDRAAERVRAKFDVERTAGEVAAVYGECDSSSSPASSRRSRSSRASRSATAPSS